VEVEFSSGYKKKMTSTSPAMLLSDCPQSLQDGIAELCGERFQDIAYSQDISLSDTNFNIDQLKVEENEGRDRLVDSIEVEVAIVPPSKPNGRKKTKAPAIEHLEERPKKRNRSSKTPSNSTASSKGVGELPDIDFYQVKLISDIGQLEAAISNYQKELDTAMARKTTLIAEAPLFSTHLNDTELFRSEIALSGPNENAYERNVQQLFHSWESYKENRHLFNLELKSANSEVAINESCLSKCHRDLDRLKALLGVLNSSQPQPLDVSEEVVAIDISEYDVHPTHAEKK
jgi:hypothetical protein